MKKDKHVKKFENEYVMWHITMARKMYATNFEWNQLCFNRVGLSHSYTHSVNHPKIKSPFYAFEANEGPLHYR